MRLRLLPIITIIVGFVGSAQAVYADPVTAWFNVNVTSGYVITPGGRYSPVDPFSFVMSATFDDQVQSYDVRSGGIHQGSSYTRFGPPTFAGVPEGPASGGVPRGWTTFDRVNDFDRDYYYLRPQLYNYVEEYQDPITGLFNQSRVFLENRLFESPNRPYDPAQGTAAELLAALRSGQFSAQNIVSKEPFGYFDRPGSYTYQGSFTQLDSAPVPEPASMLLVATGLLGAGVRRWRQKRT